MTSDENTEPTFDFRRQRFLASADQAERLQWWNTFERAERQRLFKSLTEEEIGMLEVDRQRFLTSFTAADLHRVEEHRQRFMRSTVKERCLYLETLPEQDYMRLRHSLSVDDHQRLELDAQRFIETMTAEDRQQLEEARKEFRKLFELPSNLDEEVIKPVDDAYFEKLRSYATTGVWTLDPDVEQERETYERCLPELVRQHLGKHVAISGTEVVVRDSHEDALTAGLATFQATRPFLIKRIVAVMSAAGIG